MNTWFDSHLHIDPEHLAFAPEIFAKSKAAGVEYMMVQSTSLEDIASTVALTAEPGVYATAGLHPHVADIPYEMEYVRSFLSNPRVRAIGEIGLDYFYDFSSRKNQHLLFERHLQLAVETKMPVVIHSREAFEDTYAIVKANLPEGFPLEIHSYTGTVVEAVKWLELGAMMSVNGMITFKKADNVRDILGEIPLERLLVETDSPYLAPVPLRGQENTPANIPLIGEHIAQLKGIPIGQVAQITTDNAKSFFGIVN